MFRNHYQGGAVVEIFSGQGKNPVANWKLYGGPSAIHKEYDKEVKGFVYCLNGSCQTVKMQMPENGKMSLGLIQRYLVLQVNIPPCKDFSTELVISDSKHLKRRLHLSTLYKELSVTPLHAKIPFVELKRNIWSTLCIDVESLSSELLTGFEYLDGITLCATCKVRRIFTLKAEPMGRSDYAGLMGLIPRSCQYPPDVNQVTQVLTIISADKATGCPRRVSQVGVHSASGSGASGPAPQTERKGNATSDRVFTHNMVVKSSRMKQEATESQNITYIGENPSNLNKDESSCSAAEEDSGVASIPAEFQLRSVWSGVSPDLLVQSSRETNEGSEPPLGLHEEAFTFSSPPHSPKRGQGQSDQGRMEMRDVQFHSECRGRRVAQPEDDFIGSESDEDNSYTAFKPQAKTTTPEAAMEVQQNFQSFTFNQTSQRESSTTRKLFSPRKRANLAELVPPRCLSPTQRDHNCFPRTSVEADQDLDLNTMSVCRGLLQELKLNDSKQHQEEEVETLKLTDSSLYNSDLLDSPEMHGEDDQELRMLASLKREQEEDECRASGFSASQIHQCNVSVGMSSDDTCTWTHISMPANQGHHYQKEMTPLRQSSPRERMDVLSPPIILPSRQRRSGNTLNNSESLVPGRNKPLSEEEDEDDYLNLLYDACLKCYFDPETEKYYELA